MRLFRLLALLPLSLLVACSAEESATSSDESNLDTSGCGGLDVASRGPVQLSMTRSPTTSCWNIDNAGVSLGYSWSQTNNATPQWSKIGFWMSVNGADTFVAADSYECFAATTFGPGHDTSGTRRYSCWARASRVRFNRDERLKNASYASDGRRLPWNMQVAVARDDGSWDSLDGANYRFDY